MKTFTERVVRAFGDHNPLKHIADGLPEHYFHDESPEANQESIYAEDADSASICTCVLANPMHLMTPRCRL